ncbi:MAG: CHASE2 domain-containing protein [Synechococcales bacterium]|nr:CHASE2 domain-containing protein [Synechococcales bacterium]
MLEPGTILGDRYRILNLLGQGGFSHTYEVDDGGTIKVLKVLLESYPKAVDLFQREAKVLSQLSHPGIPKVDLDGYFTVPVADGTGVRHCLVMERIPGVDLRHWLGDRHSAPISQDLALDWLEQLIDILAQIHQRHCFHRDIKPSNIMLRPDGQLALIDFGAVREVTETYLYKCQDDITRTHLYSRGYTPMEQMQGRAVPESDFFALGRTFVHLLTGQNPLEFPMDAQSGRLIWQSHAPQISPPLIEFIDWLMAPFPGQRPASTAEIRGAIAQLQALPANAATSPTQSDLPFLRLQPQSYPAPQGTPAIAPTADATQPPLDFPNGLLVAISEMGTEVPTEARTETLVTPSVSVQRSPLQPWRWLGETWGGLPLVALWSGLVTAGVMGVRFWGMLQGMELQAYDQFLRWRPVEPADERLLLVTVDEADIDYQIQQGMTRQGSLADEALAQLLTILQAHQPRTIGLDIYRETPIPLATNNPDGGGDRPDPHQSSHLVAVCAVGGGDTNYSAISPPPEMPLAQVGFSDLPRDRDNLIRRQILGMTPEPHCDTANSLSFQVAVDYLSRAEGVPNREEALHRLSEVANAPVLQHTAAYHRPGLGGYELMLNYRRTDRLAPQISLAEILTGARAADLPDLVTDRVVLIGTIDRSFGDYHFTPYGEQAGVVIQAQMVSQLLSAVLDQRPLIWWLPQWGDALWLWGWALLGGMLVRWGRSPWPSGAMLIGSMAGMGGVSFVVFLGGGWLPVVPTLLAIALTGIGVSLIQARPSTPQAVLRPPSSIS